MKRTKTWRTSAAEKEAAARAALPPPVPRSPAHSMLRKLDVMYPGIAAAVDQSNGSADPHADLGAALKASMDGLQRAGGRRAGMKGATTTQRADAIVDALRRHNPEWLTNRSTANMHAAIDWLTKQGIVPRGSLLPDSLARKLRRLRPK